ncbi:hypothetical protein [Streptomyces sp. JNUCC 63]
MEGRGGGWRHGWSVLVRSGMAAWSRAMEAVRGPGGQQPDRLPALAGDVADDLGTELVHVLASLVLGHGLPP